MRGSHYFATLAREKWFLLGCALLVLNLYGIFRRSPAGRTVAETESAAITATAAVGPTDVPPLDRVPPRFAPPAGRKPAASSFAIIAIQAHSPPFEEAFIRVQLSHRVDANALRSAIALEPHANYSVDVQQGYFQRHFADLRGNLVKGADYTVTIRQGLSASDGTATLENDFIRVISVPDAQPHARIASPGRYLSPQGALLLPVQSINAEDYTLRARRIPAHNLVQYAMREGRHYRRFYGRPDDDIGTMTTNRTFTLTTLKNTVCEHSAPLRELLPANPRGAYVIDLMLEQQIRDTRMIVVTDTGISAKLSPTELLVWANAIHSLDAVADATVKAWSSAAELLSEGRTDPQGVARLSLAAHGDSRPFMVTVETEDDLSFLDLTAARLPADSVDAAQDYLAESYEAFLHTDRGVYRPSETAHVRGIVRGRHFALPPSFPVDLEVQRPDGSHHSRQGAVVSSYGTVEFAVTWADFDPTGRYTLALKMPGSDNPLGATTLALEEFAPPIITVQAQTDQPRYRIGEEGKLRASAQYLYGAPASGHPVSVRLTVVPSTFSTTNYPDHAFGDAEQAMAETTLQLGKGNLDRDGTGVFAFSLLPQWRPSSMLRGVLGVTVLETGGRPVSAYAECEIHPYPLHIGLRAPGIHTRRPGDSATIDLALVDPDGAPLHATRRLDFSLHTVRWSAVMTQDANDRWRYQSERHLNNVQSQPVQTDAMGRATISFTVGTGGAYLLRVDDTESAAATSMEFFVGDEHDRWQTRSMERPGRLQMHLDKPVYRPGETAQLTVVAPFPGKALLTVEQDRVRHFDVKTFTANSGTFFIPVHSDHGPNAHVSVTMIRNVKPGDLRQVYRATGSLPLRLEAADRRLTVEIDAPDVIRPGSSLEATIRITDADGRERPSEFTLAAVDEGICRLTDFQTPDPLAHFTALRRNGVVSADLYAMLLAETESDLVSQRSHTGGDMARLLRGRLNPVRSRRFIPLARWQGAGMTDLHGSARVRIEIPEFSGQVRLMVVAVDETGFGSAHRQVHVRRSLTVVPSLPRFLAPGDTTTLTVELHNNSDEDTTIPLSIDTEGPIDRIRQDDEPIHVPRGRRVTQHYHLQARQSAGMARVSLRAELGEDVYAETIELPIRPAAPRTTRIDTVMVPPGESRRLTLPGDWIEGTGQYGLKLSERPTVTFTGALESLLQYPYGCLEQTISTAFPLLFMKDMQALFGNHFRIGDVSPMVEDGIRRTLAMQLDDGRFGYWPHTRDAYEWGSLYAMEFLVEARTAGYEIAAEALDDGVQSLRRLLSRPVRGADDIGSDAWRADAALRAHACHVLARAGQPRHDWTTRLLEQSGFLDDDTHLRLVLALVAGGRRRDAWNALQSITETNRRSTARQIGDTLVSPARTAALRLHAFSELAPEDPRTVAALRTLEARMDNGRWHTTQENAMALRALSVYLRQTPAENQGFHGHVEQHGIRTAFTSDVPEDVSDILREGEFTLFNAGPAPLYAVWQATGIPLGADAIEIDNRVTIRRTWLDLEGKEPEILRAHQGDVRVVRLTIDTLGERIDNLVVEELLPAGLEIENVNLRTSETVGWAARDTTLPIRHAEVRDDRLIVFAGPFNGRRNFHYVVRAISPGRYTLPQTSVEAMYDPFISSRSGAGVFHVDP